MLMKLIINGRMINIMFEITIVGARCIVPLPIRGRGLSNEKK